MTPATMITRKGTHLTGDCLPPQHLTTRVDSLVKLHRLERQHANDLHSGALMQQRFLTPPSEVCRTLQSYGYNMAVHNQSPHKVAGNFICARPLNDGNAALLLGATAGNGLSAAMLSIRVATLVQSLAITQPGSFLEFLHRDLSELLHSGTFVTASFAILSGNQVRIANAGQPLPLLLRNGATTEIMVSGIPLGLPLGAGQYRDVTLELQAGDRIIFYTDGITTSRDAFDGRLTQRTLRNWLEQYPTICTADLLAETVGEISRFTAGAQQHNDMSLIIMEYLG
ncbi:serine/threonine-protein phosphatase [Desulfovibrio mangrovi]|uniref:PP2C family protein-serine/threonine phosphatase n=1 Tax=Desulfovibrio mangrovi TaxID=2976983 RepID=UPI0022485EB4|nr:PP2C family protein-serine/threonine phosphatase [Desulfovibrio mangrovi]UZP65963.1 serine/threonine-protein phosphatase [Desulfovibrio mangrovi]